MAVVGAALVVAEAARNRFQYSSFAVNLNPKRARPPATMSASQLTHIGTDQSPIITGHSIKIRTRWNSATKVKMIPANIQNVFRSMTDHPNLKAAPHPSRFERGSDRAAPPLY